MTYKVFANGNPLQASEINQNLMQQAIAVFTDAAARDAAIAVPVNGQFAYLTGTGALVKYNGASWVTAEPATDLSGLIPKSIVTASGDLIYATGDGAVTNLAKGTDDQVLTLDSGIPAWTTPAGSSPYTLITSGTIDALAVLDISNIPQTYDSLSLRLDNISDASTGGIEIQVNGNTSNMYQSLVLLSNSSNVSYENAFSRMRWRSGFNAADCMAVLDFPMYSKLDYQIVHFLGSNPSNTVWGTGHFNSRQTISRITSLNTFGGGNYELYGLTL